MYYANPNLSAQEARVLNLASMTLNQSPNMTQDYKNILDTLKVFSDILKDSGVNNKFSNSLDNSQSYIDFLFSQGYPNVKINEKDFFSKLNPQLKTLEKDTNDSLLLIPLHTNGHIFTGTLRKLSKKNMFGMDSSSYSLLVTNAGDRAGEKTHVEYKFNSKREMKKVLYKLNNFKFEQPAEAYKYLDKKSFEKHDLSIIAKEQNVGNCWVKEFEKGIKASLIPDEIMQSAKNNIPVHAGYEELIQKTTLEMHTKFIDKLKSMYSYNSNIQKGIEEIFDDYLINKDLRDRINDQKTALKEFDPRKAVLKMDSRNIRKFALTNFYFDKVFKGIDKPLKDSFKEHIDHLYLMEKKVSFALRAYDIAETKNLSIAEKHELINKMHTESKDLIAYMEKRNLMNIAPNFYREKKMQLSGALASKSKELLVDIWKEEEKHGGEIKKSKKVNKEKFEPKTTIENALHNIEKFNEKDKLRKLEKIKEISDYSKELCPMNREATIVSKFSGEDITKAKKILFELDEKKQTPSNENLEKSKFKFDHQIEQKNRSKKQYTEFDKLQDISNSQKRYGQMSKEELREEIKTLERVFSKVANDDINVTNLHTALRSLKRKSIEDRQECEKKLEHVEKFISDTKKIPTKEKETLKKNMSLNKEDKGITI